MVQAELAACLLGRVLNAHVAVVVAVAVARAREGARVAVATVVVEATAFATAAVSRGLFMCKKMYLEKCGKEGKVSFFIQACV